MASIVSAGTTSATALNMSGDTSGVLQLASNNGTTAVTIDTSQNTGFGTTSPVARVHSTASSNQLTISEGSAFGATFDYRSSTGNLSIATNGINPRTSPQMVLDLNGNLLVGGTAVTNSAKIEAFYSGASLNGIVSNDTASASGTTFFACSNNGTLIGNIARVGATSSVIYNTTSDQRLKSNIEDAIPVLEKLMSVKVRQYDWTEGELHQDYGFIAQELEPILSGIVTKGKTEEDTWQLDYSRLTPHLVKAIQELKAELDTVKAELAALKG